MIIRICVALIVLLLAIPVMADDLGRITVAPELDGGDYDRKRDFGDWVDADEDGQDTRQEVMADESLVPVTWSEDGKKVVAGLWYDPFTGMTFPQPLEIKTSGYKYAIVQIDHIVPLKEAWESGAKNWTREQAGAFRE